MTLVGRTYEMKLVGQTDDWVFGGKGPRVSFENSRYGRAEMRRRPLSRVTKPQALFNEVRVVHRLFKHFLSLSDVQISVFRPPRSLLGSPPSSHFAVFTRHACIGA